MDSIAFLQKVFVSIAIGALIGLEREYDKKQVFAGLRTFSLISFFGMLSVFLSQYAGAAIVPISFIAVLVFISFFRFFVEGVPFGLTTLFSMVLSFLFGLMVGYGLFFEAITAALFMVFILLGRRRLHSFVKEMTHEKIVDLVEFAIIAFVVYPILPQEPVKILFVSFDLHLLWYTIVVVSLIHFMSFMAARKLGNLGLVASIFLGSLLSSALMIAQLTKLSKKLGTGLVPAFNIAIITMLIRNFLLVALIAPQIMPALLLFVIPLIFIVFRGGLKFKFNSKMKEERRPFSVNYAVEIAVFVFLLITIIGILKDNTYGIIITSIFSGFISSAPTVASILFSLSSGMINAPLAELTVCLATIASLLPDILLVDAFASSGFKGYVRDLIAKMVIVGLAIALLLFFFI